MLEQLLQLLGIESVAFGSRVLLRKSLMNVEVVADNLDTSAHNSLHRKSRAIKDTCAANAAVVIAASETWSSAGCDVGMFRRVLTWYRD